MWGLGCIGKNKTFENVRKRLKTNTKRSKIDVKRSKIFENIRLFQMLIPSSPRQRGGRKATADRSWAILGAEKRKSNIKNQRAKLQIKIQNDLLLMVIDMFCRILVLVNHRLSGFVMDTSLRHAGPPTMEFEGR